jgi:hypothetical protein
MLEKPSVVEVDSTDAREIERDEWTAWCARITELWSEHKLQLPFVGEVRLAEGLPFISIEHDQLGSRAAFTIGYGFGIRPIRHAIAEPRSVREEVDAADHVSGLIIEDRTRRETSAGLG